MKCDGLAYKWVAQFSDGTEVSQFDESGENEVLFKEVRDKDINCFWLKIWIADNKTNISDMNLIKTRISHINISSVNRKGNV